MGRKAVNSDSLKSCSLVVRGFEPRLMHNPVSSVGRALAF